MSLERIERGGVSRRPVKPGVWKVNGRFRMTTCWKKREGRIGAGVRGQDEVKERTK